MYVQFGMGLIVRYAMVIVDLKALISQLSEDASHVKICRRRAINWEVLNKISTGCPLVLDNDSELGLI